MANCEICGKNTNLVSTMVEGTVLKVCENCSRFGKVMESKKINLPIKKKNNFINSDVKIDDKEDLIVSDFNVRIKNAREKKGLMQEEVAKLINEKISIVQKIENKGMRPSLELIKKFERFFGLKLIERKSLNVEIEKEDFSGELTIGDLLKKAGE